MLLNLSSLYINNNMYNNNYLNIEINERQAAIYSALQFYREGLNQILF